MYNIPTAHLNAITTGDSRELAQMLPDESIDLVFCDPPYLKADIEMVVYVWLNASRLIMRQVPVTDRSIAKRGRNLHLSEAISTPPSPDTYRLVLGSSAQFVYSSRSSFCLSPFGLLFQREHAD